MGLLAREMIMTKALDRTDMRTRSYDCVDHEESTSKTARGERMIANQSTVDELWYLNLRSEY